MSNLDLNLRVSVKRCISSEMLRFFVVQLGKGGSIPEKTCEVVYTLHEELSATGEIVSYFPLVNVFMEDTKNVLQPESLNLMLQAKTTYCENIYNDFLRYNSAAILDKMSFKEENDKQFSSHILSNAKRAIHTDSEICLPEHEMCPPSKFDVLIEHKGKNIAWQCIGRGHECDPDYKTWIQTIASWFSSLWHSNEELKPVGDEPVRDEF